MERLRAIDELFDGILTSSADARRALTDNPSDQTVDQACHYLELVRDTLVRLTRVADQLRAERNAGIGTLRVQDHRKMNMTEIGDLAGVDDSTATALAVEAGFPERRTKRGPLHQEHRQRRTQQYERQHDRQEEQVRASAAG